MKRLNFSIFPNKVAGNGCAYAVAISVIRLPQVQCNQITLYSAAATRRVEPFLIFHNQWKTESVAGATEPSRAEPRPSRADESLFSR